MTSRLYILMRTDMASMTTGRMCAMASHATSVFTKNMPSIPFFQEAFRQWENETPYGFGTTIVLNGRTFEEIQNYLAYVDEDVHARVIIDPEYAIKDGDACHILTNVPTCAYVFSLDASFRIPEFELL